MGVQAADLELARFEALRAGDAGSFEHLAAEALPGLRAFAGCYVAPEAVDALVVRALAAFLAGIDVFAWRCTLRAWLYGLLADAGRGVGAPPPPAPGRLGRRSGAAPGPPDWSDLPWGARWDDRAWATAAQAVAALPVEAREVVWLHDVARWPGQETWDALACTQRRGEALLADGRDAVRAALAGLAGGRPPDARWRGHQTAAAVRLLADLAPPSGPVALPRETRAVYARWRRRRWRARLRHRRV